MKHALFPCDFTSTEALDSSDFAQHRFYSITERATLEDPNVLYQAVLWLLSHNSAMR